MDEKNGSFTTHLPPSRCVSLLAGPDTSLSEEEQRHLEGCPQCRDYVHRVLGALPRPTAEDLLARVERLREHADFPGAFRILTSVVLIDGRPEIRYQAARASARLHREMGYFEIAVEQFRSLLRSPELGAAAQIDCLNNLAWFERQKQNLVAAVALLSEAAELGRSDTSIAVRKEYAETLHQLAVVMMMRQDLALATARIEEAIRIREVIDGEERLDLARSLLVQGAIRSLMGDLDGALGLFKFALRIRIKALGPNHGDVADLLCRIGDVYKEQGRSGKTRLAYRKAISSFKKSASTLLGAMGLARCHARLAEIFPELDGPEQTQLQDIAARTFTAVAQPLPAL